MINVGEVTYFFISGMDDILLPLLFFFLRKCAAKEEMTLQRSNSFSRLRPSVPAYPLCLGLGYVKGSLSCPTERLSFHQFAKALLN